VVSLVAELRVHERQAAEELGQGKNGIRASPHHRRRSSGRCWCQMLATGRDDSLG
jgi:hypothetical protein